MRKVLNIRLSPEELTAIEISLEQKNSTLDAELQKYVEQLYTKIVPQAVREYICARTSKVKTADKKAADKPKP